MECLEEWISLRRRDFIRKEIAKGVLKKEGGRIVKAGGGTKPASKAKAKPAPVKAGPRNLIKGFGIKRTPKPAPKPAPKPKEKKPKAPKDGKILVSKMTYNKVVPEEFVYRSEEEFEYGSEYLNWDWITGITSSMEDFYKENKGDYNELSEAKRKKIDKIEEKMMMNLRPSVERELKKGFKKDQKHLTVVKDFHINFVNTLHELKFQRQKLNPTLELINKEGSLQSM